MNPIADEILSYYGHADTIASEESIDISEMLHTDSNPVANSIAYDSRFPV